MGSGGGLRYSHGSQMRMPHSSQDTSRNLSLGSAGGLPRGPGNLRPSSEMLPVGQQGTPETDVIDKWFEDLQNYEATLGTCRALCASQHTGQITNPCVCVYARFVE